MSWHTSAIFIEEREPTDFGLLLGQLGFPDGVPSGTVDFEEATSSMASGKSVAHVGGWTVICDPMFFVSLDSLEAGDAPMQSGLWSASLDAALREKSANGGRVFGFVTEGASGTHGFTWYENGDLTRAYLYQEGQIVFDEGSPLSAESDIHESDQEQRILLLMERLCVRFADLDGVEFQVFEFEDGMV